MQKTAPTRTRRVAEHAITSILPLVTEIICGLGRCQIPFVTMPKPCDVYKMIATPKLAVEASVAYD